MNAIRCEECRQLWLGKIRRGRCEPCYRRLIAHLKREGTFVPVRAKAGSPKRTLQERLFSKVTPGWGGCWIYTGKTDPYGYGVIREHGLDRKSHRVAYESVVGPIPAGRQLDHLCHSASTDCSGGIDCIHRRCINPAHLEPVTRLENVRRGEGPSSLNARKTHCVHGHEFTPENTTLRPPRSADARPERRCKACRRARQKAERERTRRGIK